MLAYIKMWMFWCYCSCACPARLSPETNSSMKRTFRLQSTKFFSYFYSHVTCFLLLWFITTASQLQGADHERHTSQKTKTLGVTNILLFGWACLVFLFLRHFGQKIATTHTPVLWILLWFSNICGGTWDKEGSCRKQPIIRSACSVRCAVLFK